MPQKLSEASEIVRTLQEAGHIAYFAGGWVRDLLMERKSDDIDIATSASVDEVKALFRKTIPVGVAFGILIVLMGENQFEVATFRKDRGYEDGRRPVGIDPATPEEDAVRRDFTINGMFYDPIEKTLHDFVGGQEDIREKTIAAIGDAHERFAEDRLRMMRAVRYATRFDFTIDAKTIEAIQTHASELLPAVAMERIWQEFKKMSNFAHFDTGLIQLHKLGLLPTIFPELKETPLSEIKKRVAYIDRFPPGSPTFAELLELFPDHDLDAIFALSEYLKLSNKEKAFAEFYHHAQGMFSMPKEWLDKLERYEWAKFYADPYAEIGLSMIGCKQEDPDAFLREHTSRQKTLAPHIERLKQNAPYLKAEHLMNAGIQPGVQMGQLIEEGWRLAINENQIDPSQLLKNLTPDF